MVEHIMLRQRTIQKAISTKGVGLHSGRRVEITLRPAAPDTGIVFHRVSLFLSASCGTEQEVLYYV